MNLEQIKIIIKISLLMNLLKKKIKIKDGKNLNSIRYKLETKVYLIIKINKLLNQGKGKKKKELICLRYS